MTGLWRAAIAAMLMACATNMMVLTTASTSASAQTAQTAPTAKPILTFDGEIALWSVAIRPEKTADYEHLIIRLRDTLLASPAPERRQQAAGWKLVRLQQPAADGNVIYVNVIDPVIRHVNYSVLENLYEAFPAESQALYAAYRSAFVQTLSIATGTTAVDMGERPVATATTNGRPAAPTTSPERQP